MKTGRIPWREGLFFLPQHFQQLERWVEGNLNRRSFASNPLAWGVESLCLDSRALGRGECVVEACRLVMKDGLVVDVPAGAEPPPSRAFELPEDGSPLAIHLCVPAPRIGIPQYSRDPERLDCRFREREVTLPDVTRSGEEGVISVAGPNLRLVFGDEPRHGLVSIKIAEVVPGPDGSPILSTFYVPPLLRVQGHSALLSLCKGLLGRSVNRAESIAQGARRRQRGVLEDAMIGFNTEGECRRLLFLQALNQHIGTLRHILSLPGVHPERLYEALVSMAQALGTYAPSPIAMPPPYHHESAGPCFAAVEATLKGLIGTLLPGGVELIKLEQRGTLWHGAIPDGDALDGCEIYLAVKGTLNPEELKARLPGALKVGSPDTINTLLRTATPGLRLTYCPSPPAQLPALRGESLFTLGLEGPQWRSVCGSGGITIHIPSWLPGLSPRLMVVRGGGA